MKISIARPSCFFLLAGLGAATALAQSAAIPAKDSQPTAAVTPAASLKPLIRTDAPVIALTHVTLFDGTGSAPGHDQTVLLDHGRIAFVGPSADATIPQGAQILDEHGKTVLPGLVGMHEHLFYISAGGGPNHLILGTEQAETAPRLYLAAGVTTARTTGSIEPLADLAIKAAIDAGKQPGPDLDVTGPYLDGNGTFLMQNQVITGPQDARETVDYWSKRGVTSFKAYMFVKPEALKAAIEEAHARSAKITGHLCSVGFSEAAEMGIDNLEHGLLVDTEFNPQKVTGVCPATTPASVQALLALDVHGTQIQGLIHTLVTHHVAVTSTLAIYENFDAEEPPMNTLERTHSSLSTLSWTDFLKLKSLLGKRSRAGEPSTTIQLLHLEMAFEREFARQGGLLLAGCDPTGLGGVVAGYGDQRSMELLIQAGFSPAEAVAIYSSHAAQYLGRQKTIGTVATGMDANLLILDGDFEHDASSIHRPEIVFKNGIGWDSVKLQASVAGLAGQR